MDYEDLPRPLRPHDRDCLRQADHIAVAASQSSYHVVVSGVEAVLNICSLQVVSAVGNSIRTEGQQLGDDWLTSSRDRT